MKTKMSGIPLWQRQGWRRAIGTVAVAWALCGMSDVRQVRSLVLAQDSNTQEPTPAVPATPENTGTASSQPADSHTTSADANSTASDPSSTVSGPSASVSETSPSIPERRPASPSHGAKEDLDKTLARRGKLIVKGATLADWMFAIMQTWKVDIHFDPTALQRETYSGQFTDAPLSEVLNTILTPKGLAYERVANGLSIVSIDSITGMKPNQVVAYLTLEYSNPTEVEPTLKFLMSTHGDLKIIPFSKTLIVIDLPDKVAQIREHVDKLERLAHDAKVKQDAELAKKQQEAEALARASQPANSPNGVPGDPSDPVSQTLTSVFPLRFVAAGDVQEAVQNLVADGLVSAMEKDNVLVVSGSDSVVRSAAQLIRQLDMPRKQVRISAVLYDVDLDALERLGVNWRNAGKARIDDNGSPNSLFDLNSSTTTTGGSSGSSSTGSTTGSTTTTTTATTGTSALPRSPFIASASPSVLGNILTVYNVSRNFDISAVLLALDQTDGARLLARPNTLVYDRRQSLIKIITEIPVQQLTQTEAGGNIGTTTFREAGISLQVTPEIADDGSVRLTVAPEFSALQGFQAGQPIIDRRTATTTVRVMSGDTLVLGGLRRHTEIETVQGIPGLMNIKYLGSLFRSHQTQVTESELIIFIQAEIVEVDNEGLLREQVALQIAEETLDHIPTATHAPFIPPCNDPYCPYHNPRPRVWRGSVLAPQGEWFPPAPPEYQYPPAYGLPPNGYEESYPPVQPPSVVPPGVPTPVPAPPEAAPPGLLPPAAAPPFAVPPRAVPAAPPIPPPPAAATPSATTPADRTPVNPPAAAVAAPAAEPAVNAPATGGSVAPEPSSRAPRGDTSGTRARDDRGPPAVFIDERGPPDVFIDDTARRLPKPNLPLRRLPAIEEEASPQFAGGELPPRFATPAVMQAPNAPATPANALRKQGAIPRAATTLQPTRMNTQRTGSK